MGGNAVGMLEIQFFSPLFKHPSHTHVNGNQQVHNAEELLTVHLHFSVIHREEQGPCVKGLKSFAAQTGVCRGDSHQPEC